MRNSMKVYYKKYKEALETWPPEKMPALDMYWIIFNKVQRYAMWPAHHEMLVRYTSECAGDHLEIGCLWGGSAIAVALVKKKGIVYCIDPCTQEDPFVSQTVTENAIRRNFCDFSTALNIDDIQLYIQYHPPMPEELEDHRFDTCLIDGNHKYKGVRDNWLDVKERVDKYVLFHDIHMKGVRPVFKMACDDPEWELAEKLERIGVVRRI